jgi:uncharacterized protein YbjT (DUF2867 family)
VQLGQTPWTLRSALARGGFVLVTGAAGSRPGSTGRWVAELLLDRGVPVRAFARTQDHRAEQLRQLGAEVVAEDLHEIADVESFG